MDESDSCLDEGLSGKAFQVEGGDDEFDLEVPPTSGNEYLRRVRLEANTCPRVVVADIDTNSFVGKQTVLIKQWSGGCHPAPQGFAPTQAWQNMQMVNFAEQRQKLARFRALRKTHKLTKLPTVPPMNDVAGWCRLCFGKLKPGKGTQSTTAVKDGVTSPAQNDSITSPAQNDGMLPLVSTVTVMDQPTVIKVLEYHLNWFEVTGFSEKQGYWFYALLLCLEKPLIPEACSLLRSLARACANLRASLESAADERLIPLNLFICLISRYFDQHDLGDGAS